MTAAWTCPACHRVAEMPSGAVASPLCSDGHGGVTMRRLEARREHMPEAVPYVSACDRAEMCQYDRYCHFFHQACRFDEFGRTAR